MRPSSLVMVTAAPTSVIKLNLGFGFSTLVAALRQPLTRSGFPSGRVEKVLEIAVSSELEADDRTTDSGTVSTAGNYPDTGYPRHTVRLCPFGAQ